MWLPELDRLTVVGSQGSTTTPGRRSTSPVESRRGNETVLPSPLRGAPGVLARPPLRRPVYQWQPHHQVICHDTTAPGPRVPTGGTVPCARSAGRSR